MPNGKNTSYRRQFFVCMSQLSPATDFVVECSRLFGFDGDDCVLNKIITSIEEAVTNIIHHSGLTAQDTFEVVCAYSDPPGITITLKDQGIPYDPVAYSKRCFTPSAYESVENREIGGLGVYLISQLMDHMTYRRENKANVFTLVKYIRDVPIS